MSLGGEKNQLKEWEGGVGKGKVQGEKVSPRFFSRAARKMSGNPGKKERFGGVLGGRWRRAHYACRRREELGVEVRRRRPASLGFEVRPWTNKEEALERDAEALSKQRGRSGASREGPMLGGE